MRYEKGEEYELYDLIPSEAGYHGAYTRLHMFVFLNEYIDKLLATIQSLSTQEEKLEEEKNKMIKMKEFLEDLIKRAMKSMLRGNPKDIVMPYSDKHKKRVYLSQMICIILKALTRGNSRVYHI